MHYGRPRIENETRRAILRRGSFGGTSVLPVSWGAPMPETAQNKGAGGVSGAPLGHTLLLLACAGAARRVPG
eukprot:CAMPEP_0179286678 /NCGR_PEP_ID=MMETSP0797-20121207/39869_1 /TAXON_ID=47934 /ORGANISM="Dinophysis acuminata, Strain DAEP01" /LENGTH=71 /DNA_ID=CAMNT_0020995577 /DNA_START=329 /DNA_END=540 /DNA_ORIENTATION=-